MASDVRDPRPVTPIEPSDLLYHSSGPPTRLAERQGDTDGLHISCLENWPTKNALDRLACRVLQSTLAQVRTR
jgi:hypothetical protein